MSEPKGYVDSKKTTVTVTPNATSGTLVGKISVDGTEKSLYAPTPSTYSLPTAAAGTKGGVKVGDTLEMGGTNSEVINVKTASTSQKGVVQIGSGLSVSNGVVSANAQTPTAGNLISVTDTRKVSIKIDPSLVNADGTVKNVDLLGVSNDQLVARSAGTESSMFPDFGNRLFDKHVMFAGTGIPVEFATNNKNIEYRYGYGGAYYELYKSENASLPYITLNDDSASANDMWVVVQIFRDIYSGGISKEHRTHDSDWVSDGNIANYASYGKVLVPGLKFSILEYPYETPIEFLNTHPFEPMGHKSDAVSEFGYELTTVFSAPIRKQTKLRVGLSEDQILTCLHVLAFGMY